jgi:SAM-dependent methyltransferase
VNSRSASADLDGGYDPALFEGLASVEDQSFWFRARNRLIVQLVSERASPGDSFLEIGCGTGYVLRALVRECGLAATGTELFADGLEVAQRRVPEAEFVQLDARSMPYHGAFDCAGAFDVIEHIDDDFGVLQGLHQALRPAGYLFITVPQHQWLWSAADTHACHVRRYQRQELVDRVTRAGFTPLRVTSFVTSLLPLMAASRWRERLFPRDYDLLADLVPPRPLNSVFEAMLGFEARLIDRGISLPFGGSLVVVARRDP